MPMKMDLMDCLAQSHPKPRYEHVRAIREYLNDTFPNIFGYGMMGSHLKVVIFLPVVHSCHFNCDELLLFQKSKRDKETPEKWQDGVYKSMIARFELAKVEKREDEDSEKTSSGPKPKKKRVPAVSTGFFGCD